MKTNNLGPWDISLEKRIKELFNAKKTGKKNAIILYPEEDKASSFRYRAYNIYQATQASKKWQLVYFFLNELDEVEKLIPDIHIMILGRITRWSPRIDELAYLAKKENVTVLQDLDDCICGTKYIKEMFNVVSPDFIDQEYWINTCAHYELLSYLSDGFIVTNKYLGEKLSLAHDKKPFKVIKNFLNHEQIEFAKEIKTEPAQTFTIGYFSGSHTHLADFEVVYPELLELLNDHSDIRLKIVGMLDLPKTAEKYVRSGQIEYCPMVDFLTLEKLAATVDLNIAPLDDNIFANCKSDLKFFEAGLVKTPTIASPTFAFRESIENGKNGFLCWPGEWYGTIVRLYKNSGLRAEIAENAYNYSLNNYAPEKCLKQIEDAYDFFTKK